MVDWKNMVKWKNESWGEPEHVEPPPREDFTRSEGSGKLMLLLIMLPLFIILLLLGLALLKGEMTSDADGSVDEGAYDPTLY